MVSRRTLGVAALAVAFTALPIVVYLVNLTPTVMAAGWIGYANEPVSPEPAALSSPLHGLAERNSSIQFGNGTVIQYFNGVVKYTADGISAPSSGFPFTYRPTYNNNHEGGTEAEDDGNADMEGGWNWHSGLFSLVDWGSGEIRLVGRGVSSSQYVQDSGEYIATMGADSRIVPLTYSDELKLLGTNGTTCLFYDFDSAHGGKAGRVKNITDAYGNQLTVTYDSGGRPDTITDPGGHTWDFTIISSGNNYGKIQKIELKDGSSGTTVLAKTEYDYFDGTSTYATGSGKIGDLMRITVTEKDSDGNDLIRQTLFRYYTQNSGIGAPHKLRYIVGPQSYAELAADADVTDPLTASDTDIAEHADAYFEYGHNDRSFVTEATVRCTGCSCDAGEGTFAFSYTDNESWTTSSGPSVWKVSVTQTNPDGTVKVVDLNGLGSAINQVLQTDDTFGGSDQRWVTHYEFDSTGRVTGVYHPSVCASYNESTHAVTLNSTTGLIDAYTYDSSGNVTEHKAMEGTSGDAYWQERVVMTSATVGSHSIYLPAEVWRYSSETTTATNGTKTELDYTFYDSSLAVQEMVVTLPAVPTAENGENATHTQAYYFDAAGHLAWERDELGSVTYRAYNAITGRLTTQIVDADTDSLSPPTGFSNSTGLHLETAYTYDDFEHPETILYPDGRTEALHFTSLSTGQPVVLKASHVDATAHSILGAESIAVFDLNGRLVTFATGVPSDGDEVLADDLDETKATLELAFVGDLYNRSEEVYENGQRTQSLQWTDAENSGATKYVTYYDYDQMGRLARVKDAEGTITRTSYTVAGRMASRSIGTNDYGATYPSGETSGTNNMTTVETLFYDGEETTASATGDGNLTESRTYLDGTSYRATSFTYDWRNRRVTTDGEEDFFAKTDYDNLGRPTVQYRYDTSESSSNLRAKSETKYDTRGRVYQSVVYEVDPSAGTVGASLTTAYWYDSRGALLKRESPSGLFNKSAYDSVGRTIASYKSFDTDETTYAESDDVTGDVVVWQAEYDRDDGGRAELETSYERKSSGSGTGVLTTANAERYYVARWYDALGRVTDVASYGTNGGSSVSRPSTAPSSSDVVLVTTKSYDLAGRLQDVTDPEGFVERRGYDNLSRVTSIISNYVDGAPGGGDDDRKQELTFDALSRVVMRKAFMTSSSDGQKTEWLYGVTKGTNLGESAITSNNLMGEVRYPDPSSGSPSTTDRKLFAYNAQGERTYLKDQLGNEREFVYDDLGRWTADKVTTLAEGVDGAIRRIEQAYDALGRPIYVTSFTTATGSTVANELGLVYNGFGQVTESVQEHGGAVDANSLSVAYAYSEAAGGDPISRLESMTYPGTDRVVYFYSDDPTAGDTGKIDWILARVSGVSNSSSSAADRIADYEYQGLGRVVKRTCEEMPDTPTSKDLDVDYAFDRFGRVATLVAESADGAVDVNSFAFGYDRNSNATYREDNFHGSRDELYTYDDLDRLDVFKRGDLNGAKDDIASPVRSRDWTLDLVGNWSAVATDGGTAVSRTHDLSNEVADVDTGYTGEDPSYDANGNTTSLHRPAPNNRVFEYDAWNRLVRVRISAGGATVAEYEYDGLNRRIRDSAPSPNLHFYYSRGWQLLSERTGGTSSDDTISEYVWGIQYVDELLERDDDTDSNSTLDRTLYYVQDSSWNVTALVSTSGSVVERVLYDPYGRPDFYDNSWTGLSASAYDNRILYTGRLWNEGTYTYDYRNREYSPYLGRFLQPDAVGDWDDPGNAGNGYGYAWSSPNNVLDWLGTNGWKKTGDPYWVPDGEPETEERLDVPHFRVVRDPNGNCYLELFGKEEARTRQRQKEVQDWERPDPNVETVKQLEQELGELQQRINRLQQSIYDLEDLATAANRMAAASAVSGGVFTILAGVFGGPIGAVLVGGAFAVLSGGFWHLATEATNTANKLGRQLNGLQDRANAIQRQIDNLRNKPNFGQAEKKTLPTGDTDPGEWSEWEATGKEPVLGRLRVPCLFCSEEDPQKADIPR